jgi:hypothetical protein
VGAFIVKNVSQTIADRLIGDVTAAQHFRAARAGCHVRGDGCGTWGFGRNLTYGNPACERRGRLFKSLSQKVCKLAAALQENS